MKDYLHRFGGMLAAILLLAAYIFDWGWIERCYGETIKHAAGDGVNEVTIELDENGYVTSQSITLVNVLEKYEADNPQPVLIGDLEPRPVQNCIPQSGDEVVVNDVTFVLIASADWRRWTNAVARLEAVAERRWANEHKTAEGRRAWHGAPTNRVVEAASVTWQYADGFTYTEQAEPSRRASPAVERMKKAAERPQGASAVRPRVNIPPRLRAKQDAISARPASKEVNATFGPGGKLLKTEGEE